MNPTRSDLWVWGYVHREVPARIPYVDTMSFCSLETAASYLNASNVIYLNSMHAPEALDDKFFAPLASCEKVVCALQQKNYLESARRISEFSLRHPNIEGAVLDDFLSPVGYTARMSPEEFRAIKQALTGANPSLRLYVVLYTFMDYTKLAPYLDSIDVINLWCWVPSAHFWEYEYHYQLLALREFSGKEVIQGIFLHNFGADMDVMEPTKPQSVETLELQCEKTTGELRMGNLEGWVFLQNGFFSRQDHRKQVQFVREYLDWHYGVWTKA